MTAAAADIFDRSIEQVGLAGTLRREAVWARAGRRRPIHGTSGSELDTLAAQVAAILREDGTTGVCIECLTARLDVSTKILRDAAQLLVVRPGFRVMEGACFTCRHRADVIAFVTPSSLPRPGDGGNAITTADAERLRRILGHAPDDGRRR